MISVPLNHCWLPVHGAPLLTPSLLGPHFYFLLSPGSAAGGEIFNQCVADNDEAFTEKDVIRLAEQILTGVAFLHRNNVVHLDLKVNAVVFTSDITDAGRTDTYLE